jgi:hypothetical protein
VECEVAISAHLNPSIARFSPVRGPRISNDPKVHTIRGSPSDTSDNMIRGLSAETIQYSSFVVYEGWRYLNKHGDGAISQSQTRVSELVLTRDSCSDLVRVVCTRSLYGLIGI